MEGGGLGEEGEEGGGSAASVAGGVTIPGVGVSGGGATKKGGTRQPGGSDLTRKELDPLLVTGVSKGKEILGKRKGHRNSQKKNQVLSCGHLPLKSSICSPAWAGVLLP